MAKTPRDLIAAPINSSGTLPQKAPTPRDLLQGINSYTGGYQSFGDSQYLKNYTASTNAEKIKAHNQGFWDEFGNALVQSGAGFGLGLAESVGYLGVGTILDKARGTEQEVGNTWSNYFKGLNEQLKKEVVPVYQGDSGHWHEWFNSNLPTIIESLALLLPAKGISSGIGVLAKAIGGLKAAKRIGMLAEDVKFADAVIGAGISRHMENSMEEIEAYNRLYQEGISKGLNEVDAKKAAKEAANEVYWKNWPLVTQDILQFSLANKSFGALSRAKSAEDAAKSLVKSTGLNTALNAVGAIVPEGIEEQIQHVISEEAVRKSAIKHSIREEDYKTYPERLMDYIADPDFWTAGVWGAAGGAAFHVVGTHLENKSEQQQKVVGQYQKSVLEKYNALYDKNPIAFAKSQDVDNAQMIIDGIRMGRADQVERIFQNIKDMDISSLPEEQHKEALESIRKADIALGDLKVAEQEYNSYKSNPTSSSDPKQIEAFRIANRLELKSNQRLQSVLDAEVTNHINTIKNDRNLNSSEILLLEAQTKKKILLEEYKDTNIAEKDIIEDNIKQLDKTIQQHLDILQGNGQTKEETETKLSKINKSILAQKISEKWRYDLRIQQNNKDYDKLDTSKGKQEIKDQINKFDDEAKQKEYDKTITSLTPNSKLDDYRKALNRAKELGKEKQFKQDSDLFLSNIKKAAPPFEPTNVKASLDKRYENNNFLKESEGNHIASLMIKNGGLPADREFNNDLIAEQYQANSQLATKINNFFDIKNVVNKEKNIGKQPIVETTKQPTSPEPPKENIGKLSYAWNLQGIQFENNDITKPVKSNIDWAFINQGRLPQNATLHIEYDFDNKYSKEHNNVADVVFELVYYKDGNQKNKQHENRHSVGYLSGLNKEFTSPQDKQDLENLRKSLFEKVQANLIKSGYMELGVSTQVNYIIGGRIYNTPIYSNPLEILRPDQELVLAIGVKHRQGEEIIIKYETNGHEYQDKIHSYTPKLDVAGSVFILLPDGAGKIIPIKLYTKKVKEVPQMLGHVVDIVKRFKQPLTTEVKDRILEDLQSDVSILDINYNNGNYVFSLAPIENPTIVTKKEEELEEFLGDLIVQIDVKQINQGDYNKNVVNHGLITTDLQPFTHFHSTKIAIKNPMKLEAKLDIKGQDIPPISPPAQTKKGVVRKEIKGIAPADITIGEGKKKDKYSKVKEEQYTPINLDETSKWFAKNLPQVSVEIVPHLIEIQKNGSYAWGVFKDASAVIQLYRRATTTTGQHEAFHAVFSLFLNDKEREIILNEMAGLSNMTRENTSSAYDDILEERLAELFEKYVTDQGRNVDNLGYNIRNFFRKLWETIKQIFSPNVTSIDNLMFRINNQFYADSHLPIRYKTETLPKTFGELLKDGFPSELNDRKVSITNTDPLTGEKYKEEGSASRVVREMKQEYKKLEQLLNCLNK